VIGFFHAENTPLEKRFIGIANNQKEWFRFATTHSKDVYNHCNFTNHQSESHIVVYQNVDNKYIEYFGPLSDWAMENFIYESVVPTVGILNDATSRRYKLRALPILKVYVEISLESIREHTNYLSLLNSVAKHHNRHLSFVICNKNDFSSEMQLFGFDRDAQVSVGIDDISKSVRYQFTQDFNVENLEQFVHDFKDGKLQPFLRSDPIPEEDGDHVKVVVGKTFEKIVLDKNKDVMIEFYAPWCGHCKTLAPIYEEVASNLAISQPNVVLAKMDATTNDSPHPSYSANSYPTIFWAPANSKDKPLQYNGERDVFNITKWIKSKSKKWIGLKDEL